MPTKVKSGQIGELESKMQANPVIILTDYRGLSVSDLRRLRDHLHDVGAEYHIAKNTLLRIAAERAGINGLTPLLEGPTAIAIAPGDEGAVAKVLQDYVRTSHILSLKGALLGRSVLSAAETAELAQLPPRIQIQANLLGTLQGPLASLVGTLQSTLQSLVYALDQRTQQMDEAGSAS